MNFEREPESFEAIVRQAMRADRSPAARIRAVLRAIDEDPGGDHRLERLAERAAMSPRSLQRRFARAAGLPPARYVERARVHLALRLLEETGLPVKAVAQRCGFGAEERMRRAFHRVLGCPPRGCARIAAAVPSVRAGASRTA